MLRRPAEVEKLCATCKGISTLRDTFRSIELGKKPEMRKEVSADFVVKDIRRRIRRKYSAEEKKRMGGYL